MVIHPKIRGFICTTAHPKGCEANVLQQINFVKKQGEIKQGPKKALIIGASTGYGLASRITAAFGSHAKTIGVFFEKEPAPDRTASAGWYNNVAFEKFAAMEGLYTKSINGDAFSDEIRNQTIEIIKKDMGSLDLIVYSIASPRRVHPKTGEVYKSVLKPIGKTFSGKTLDTDKKEIKNITIEAATESEINDTINVMGGEDWEYWIEALDKAGLLAPQCKTIAYTYLGAKPTWDIYGHGTIGKAKLDLERATKAINERLVKINGHAYLGVMKAIVTQASSAIPIMPLYISLLYKIMKARNLHEGAIEQVYRLFSTKLYHADTATSMDAKSMNSNFIDKNSMDASRIRMDDRELLEDIQKEVEKGFTEVNTENLYNLTDFKGYQEDFLKLFGFNIPSIDYDADVDPMS